MSQISEEGERRITIAIAIALVALIPSIILGALLWHEVRVRTDANRELLQAQAVVLAKLKRSDAQQARLRVQARAAIRAADKANCESDEDVKARLRELVKFKPEQVAETLRQLGIDPASSRGQQLTKRSKESSDEAVAALAPRDCSKLPAPGLVPSG